MEEKTKESKKRVKKCLYCGTEIDNSDLNYCPNCKNVIWAKGMFGRRWL